MTVEDFSLFSSSVTYYTRVRVVTREMSFVP